MRCRCWCWYLLAEVDATTVYMAAIGVTIVMTRWRLNELERALPADTTDGDDASRHRRHRRVVVIITDVGQQRLEVTMNVTTSTTRQARAPAAAPPLTPLTPLLITFGTT